MFSDPEGEAVCIIAKQVYLHAVSILIGFTEDPASDAVPDVHVASAGVIQFGEATCAVTCYHVIDDFEILKSREPRYKFQIGSFVCEPRERLRDFDAALDLAILDVTDIPIERLSGRDDGLVQALKAVRWPADPPNSGDLVILCGFPIATRETDIQEKKFVSVAFPLVERVRDVEAESFTVTFDREKWVSIPSDKAAPPQIKEADVNGLSGSPVFSSFRNVQGSIGVMEFIGTVLSEIPFGEQGVRVRSSGCIDLHGRIVRA